jgi:hypothetical protein
MRVVTRWPALVRAGHEAVLVEPLENILELEQPHCNTCEFMVVKQGTCTAGCPARLRRRW